MKKPKDQKEDQKAKWAAARALNDERWALAVQALEDNNPRELIAALVDGIDDGRVPEWVREQLGVWLDGQPSLTLDDWLLMRAGAEYQNELNDKGWPRNKAEREARINRLVAKYRGINKKTLDDVTRHHGSVYKRIQDFRKRWWLPPKKPPKPRPSGRKATRKTPTVPPTPSAD